MALQDLNLRDSMAFFEVDLGKIFFRARPLKFIVLVICHATEVQLFYVASSP